MLDINSKVIPKSFRAIKLRLYPNKEQEDFFQKNCGCVRWIYNKALAHKIKVYKETGKSISTNKMSQFLPKFKEKYFWLAEADSTSLQQALLNLDQAYKNFFRRVKQGGAPGFPKFKKKGSKESFRVVMSTELKDNLLRIGKHGWIKVQGSTELLENKKIKSITVSLDAGKWFASCLIEYSATTDHIHKYPKVGIDVGVVQPLTLAYFNDLDGELVHKVLGKKFSKDLAKKELKRKHYQRLLAHKQKGSKNREKAKLRVQIAFQKERNCRKEFIEKASHVLATNFKVIKFEDLLLSNMTKQIRKNIDGSPRKGVSAKAGLNREMLRLGLATLVTRTQQKAAYYQGNVVLIDPRFTSQRCSSCGSIDKENRKSQAEFKCVSCSHEANADCNAATNILFRKAA